MRIAIREQLGLLVLFACLVSVAVLSVAVWITNTNFVTSVSSSSLSLAATLYAQQLGTNILLIQNSIQSIATRVLVQTALSRYASGNNTDANWIRAAQDIQAGLGSGAGQYLLQARLFGRDGSGLAGRNPVLNATSNSTSPIELPERYENGTAIKLGDNTTEGYPQYLYPQLSIASQPIGSNMTNITGSYNGFNVDQEYPLLVGPFPVNETFSLASITIPIVDPISAQVVGWITVVFSCELIYLVAGSILGLGNTGLILIVSPEDANNRVAQDINNSSSLVRFVVPPVVNATRGTNRHPGSGFQEDSQYTFTYKSFPAVNSVFMTDQHAIANAGSSLDSTNEIGARISVGSARVNSKVADWAVIIEESYDEVHAPFENLRNVLLACIFGTIGAILLVIFPLAHYSVRPIRALREATHKTVDPYDFSETSDRSSKGSGEHSQSDSENISLDEEQQASAKKEGFLSRNNPFSKRRKHSNATTPANERKFRIPGKVDDGKHFIYDELTDLTTTFNGMCDELMMQYASLEERVKERTAELELSKKAAEAANESKTLFIANISHELKTPLNGILGMCAVSMSEHDPSKIKKSLNIIYKSGDLLLNLLTDLLTFSKNQIGQHLTLDEKEFRLSDISSQVLSIFDKQAREGQISLNVCFEGPAVSLDTASGNPGEAGYGPLGTGRVRDMWLWGDQHRILQVVINLVSNSLKFTPAGGAVTVRVQCLGEMHPAEFYNAERKDSSLSRNSRISAASGRSGNNSGKSSRKGGSSRSSMVSPGPSPQLRPHKEERDMHTCLQINTREPKILTPTDTADRPASALPINAKILVFNFEVEDTGPGIPPAQQKKIFEPFVQGDLGLSKKYGGTGLGLSICSQLASLMKGHMSLRSIEGQGSIFSMEIPLTFVKEQAESISGDSAAGSARNSLNITITDEMQSLRGLDSPDPLSAASLPSSPTRAMLDNASSKPRLVGLSQPFFAPSPSLDPGPPRIDVMERMKAEAQSKGSKVRVLVAEDNKVNQEVVLRMLKLEDIYNVTVAKDGQEAYEVVKQSMEEDQLFDLIFMDVQMPNLDGLQSTRLIRGIGFSAPIVALTAFAEESNVKECLDSGMDFFLPKPIRRPALKQVLNRYCTTIVESEEPESPPMDKKTSALDARSSEIGSEPGSAGSSTVPAYSTTQTSPGFGATERTNPLETKIDDHNVSPLS